MKKTLAVLSIAVLGLSTIANAQQRRDPRDPRNRNSCEQQIQRMRTRLQTLQQRNIIVDQERQQCVSDLQSARQNQSMIRQNLNQCEADLAAARNRPGNGHEMRRLRRENERLSSDNVALQSENQELRDRIFRLERQLDDLRNPPAPMNEYTAECHIDDDPGMTFDQFVMGTLTGSLQRIQQDCKDMAVSQYGTNSSQGFKKLKYIGDTFGKTSAVCHIDDDPGMTYDQFVVGTLYGNSVQEVIFQCESMARFTFGNNSSSGIKNVRNN